VFNKSGKKGGKGRGSYVGGVANEYLKCRGFSAGSWRSAPSGSVNCQSRAMCVRRELGRWGEGGRARESKRKKKCVRMRVLRKSRSSKISVFGQEPQQFTTINRDFIQQRHTFAIQFR